MIFYCVVVVFPTGSVRLESFKEELDSCTGRLGESAFAGGSPFTVVRYNEIPPIIEKLTRMMTTKNTFNKSVFF
ncbi:MAG: hypothetical protein ACHQ1D_05335 [Nitrososphaerales archaeon]